MTTGPITVPLVLAMGLGIGGQVGVVEGFGILAMASVYPIVDRARRQPVGDPPSADGAGAERGDRLTTSAPCVVDRPANSNRLPRTRNAAAMPTMTPAARITCEVDKSLSAQALSALGAMHFELVQVHPRRAVVLSERAALPFLPPTTRLEEDPVEVYEVYLPRAQARGARTGVGQGAWLVHAGARLDLRRGSRHP